MKNYVSLIGNVGQDPSVKVIGEKKVCKFSLATSETYKKDGEKVTNTTWHNLVMWSPLADIAEKYIKKGSQISIDGKIQYRSYDDKDGNTKDITEIICNNLILLSKKESKEEPKEEKWQGKKDVKSMSKAEDLPGYIDNGSVPDDNNIPF